MIKANYLIKHNLTGFHIFAKFTIIKRRVIGNKLKILIHSEILKLLVQFY